MRTMKDKERFFIIVKIFLHLNGPSTAKEISEYIKKCPVRLQKDFSSVKVATMLRGQNWLRKDKSEGIMKYEV